MPTRITPARRAAIVTGCSAIALSAAVGAAHAGNLINGDLLLVSATTYEDVGQVAGLVAGVTQIPGGTANAARRPQLGLEQFLGRRAIRRHLAARHFIDLSTTNASVLAQETLNTSQVVTSFSSKSELGLNITKTASGLVATVMGYTPGGAGYPSIGVGMLDVSNADNPAYIDTTNVASQFYKGSYTDYAFNRSVVAVGASGSYTITPTTRLRRRQQPRRGAGAKRPLLHGRQFQQRHDHEPRAHPAHRPRGRDAGIDAELDDGRSELQHLSGVSELLEGQGGKDQQLPRR